MFKHSYTEGEVLSQSDVKKKKVQTKALINLMICMS